MSYPARSPTSSSSTLIQVVSPFSVSSDHHHPHLLNDDDDGGCCITTKTLELVDDKQVTTTIPTGWSDPSDKRMSGKGFIEPRRNNLPRRNRTRSRVVTTAAVSEDDKTKAMEEAGPSPCSSIVEEAQDVMNGVTTTAATPVSPPVPVSPPMPVSLPVYASSPSAGDTNITEPPSSRRASSSPTPSVRLRPPLHKSPPEVSSYSPASVGYYPITSFHTPKPARLGLGLGLGLDLDLDLDGASPLQPPITPTKGHLQPTSATLPRRRRSVARELERRRGLESRQRKESVCAQELSKGIVLGFLGKGEENVVRIQVYDGSTTTALRFSSLSSSELPPSPPPSPITTFQLSLPADCVSYVDGTTSLTDCQIQEACAFIDGHISKSDPLALRPERAVSVVIFAPRMRPEEAMSIGVAYLAGIENAGEGRLGELEASDEDYKYSAVHQLLMGLHDDPIVEGKEVEIGGLKDVVKSRLGGLRAEWRGVLSFDGMQRLDRVWTNRL